MSGWPGGPTVIQRIVLADVEADLEAEGVAVEGQRGLGVGLRKERV